MIVALTGKAGSGKDHIFRTIAEMAEEYDIPQPERVAFADPLKRCMANTLGISVRDVERLKTSHSRCVTIYPGGLRLKRLSMRHLLQRLGTEGGRKVFGDAFWIDQSLPEGIDSTGRILIVTDLRFANEAQRVRSLGGLIYRVQGPAQPRRRRWWQRAFMDKTATTHVSEDTWWSRDLWPIDNTVRDDGGIVLRHELRAILPVIAERFFAELRQPIAETGTSL